MINDLGLCIDFHIHSKLSFHKDGEKVNDNKIENIEVLINKLNSEEHKVNMAAITDHDMFDFDLYKKFKEFEGNEYLKKVLPGIEFSVDFKVDDDIKQVHIIVIFNDVDNLSLSKIPNILSKDGINPDYDNASGFSESKFLEIMSEINLSAVLIAHQKNSLSSSKPRKADAMYLGEEKFNDFIYSGYFDAFEFRNKSNEVFNNVYMVNKDMSNDITFISGTDNHDWNKYPSGDAKDETCDYNHTYLKCLPTFKGVAMALTEHTRIKNVNSFSHVSSKVVDEIEIKLDENPKTIPLSRGINAIIGDNSVGKSLFLNALLNYPDIKKGTISGYEKYLNQIKLEIATLNENGKVYQYDRQGDIRKNFSQGHLKAKDFFGDKYPSDIDTNNINTIFEDYWKKFKNIVEHNDKYLKSLDTLPDVLIESVEQNSESIIISEINIDFKSLIDVESNIKSKITSVSTANESLSELIRNVDDKKKVDEYSSFLDTLKEKHSNRENEILSEQSFVNDVNGVLNETSKIIETISSNNQKEINRIEKEKDSLIDNINNTISLERQTPATINVSSQEITPKSIEYGDYKFGTALPLENIDEEVLKKILCGLLKAGTTFTYDTINTSQLKDSIVRINAERPILDDLYSKFKAEFEKQTEQFNSIVLKGENVTKKTSDGFNSKVYFDIISNDTSDSGVYYIDQPEDDVSQKAINEILIPSFRQMSKNRQVILITHNPQLVVNLDVDNVIVLKKDESNKFSIVNGALEYENDEYSILNEVADTLDGGIDAIKRRWRRYDK